MAQNGGDAFDQYSFHTYGDSYGSVPGSISARKNVAGGKPVNMSEFGWSDDNASGWNSGYANYVIAGANLGLHSMLVWQLNGTWTVDPDGDTNGTYNMWDALPLGLEPRETFLSAGLLNRYIPAHSQVLASTSSSSDVRSAAFRDAAGDYTVLVESKGAAPTDLTVDFGGTAVNADFHRVVYSDDLVPDANALLPAVSATLPAGTSFSDDLDTGYSFAVYTTADPACRCGWATSSRPWRRRDRAADGRRDRRRGRRDVVGGGLGQRVRVELGCLHAARGRLRARDRRARDQHRRFHLVRHLARDRHAPADVGAGRPRAVRPRQRRVRRVGGAHALDRDLRRARSGTPPTARCPPRAPRSTSDR